MMCQRTLDEYTSERRYYKWDLGLTAIATEIPADALEVGIGGIIKKKNKSFQLC